MRENHVKEFMEATMQTVGLNLTSSDVDAVDETLALEGTLIAEECKEFLDELIALRQTLTDGHEITNEMIGKFLKELADLRYVTSHCAAAFGLPAAIAFYEVHHSNMSKLDDDGEPELRADGKVLKGDNYIAPDFDFIVEQYVDKD